jgi:NAD(P)-dependent dehydrogenase (short-subunit alcohol dehydrogenase family)
MRGYALFAAVEEANEADVLAQFETNFFGALRVIQAALSLLRQQNSGHILGVANIAGLVAGPQNGLSRPFTNLRFDHPRVSAIAQCSPFFGARLRRG